MRVLNWIIGCYQGINGYAVKDKPKKFFRGQFSVFWLPDKVKY